MLVIPPLLFSLITEDKVSPISVKVYKILKIYQVNDEVHDLGTILSDMEIDYPTFLKCTKQLIDYGFVERIKHPGKKTEYKVLNGTESK
jgi:DNA-binding MarR family transcriptional regulator